MLFATYIFHNLICHNVKIYERVFFLILRHNFPGVPVANSRLRIKVAKQIPFFISNVCIFVLLKQMI